MLALPLVFLTVWVVGCGSVSPQKRDSCGCGAASGQKVVGALSLAEVKAARVVVACAQELGLGQLLRVVPWGVVLPAVPNPDPCGGQGDWA